jgi:hypothetical protein
MCSVHPSVLAHRRQSRPFDMVHGPLAMLAGLQPWHPDSFNTPSPGFVNTPFCERTSYPPVLFFFFPPIHTRTSTHTSPRGQRQPPAHLVWTRRRQRPFVKQHFAPATKRKQPPPDLVWTRLRPHPPRPSPFPIRLHPVITHPQHCHGRSSVTQQGVNGRPSRRRQRP